jgi:hypothetical protein
LWQIAKKNNLREKELMLPHHFRGFSPGQPALLFVDHGGAKLLTSWWPEGEREREREREGRRKGPGTRISFKGILPVTYFLQVGPPPGFPPPPSKALML